jgi:hypothetical protein
MHPFTLGRNDLCGYGSLFAASALAPIPVSCSAFRSRIALWQTGIGTDHPERSTFRHRRHFAVLRSMQRAGSI